MRFHYLKIFFFFIVLFQLACINCRLVECQGASEIIKLKWVKDGHNAVFGPEASINRDSVRFYDPETENNDFYISYNDLTQTMDLIIDSGRKYVLEIKNTRIDTISGTFKLIERGECCDTYQLTKVIMNSQVVCEGNCDHEIIEVQL